MDSDDTLDLAIITVLLNEARKCLDIITRADEGKDVHCSSNQNSASRTISPYGLVDEVTEEVDDDDDMPDEQPDKTFDKYIDKLCHNDPEIFKENTTISMEAFNLLYDLVKHELRKLPHRSVTPKCRLFITLVYLSNGGYKNTLSFVFAMPHSTAHKVISNTCQALWKSLSKTYLSHKKESDWHKISQQFESQYHMPNCVGAIDLRRIQLRSPKKAVVSDYQKKGKYSFTILGACDANYKFTGIDVSIHEKDKEESEVWSTGFEKKLVRGLLQLPKEKLLPNSHIQFPYYFVGDSSCPLKPWIMRPYPVKSKPSNAAFDSHMNRTYEIIDNTFGVMTARWKILTTPLILAPESMEFVLKATVLLHNFALTHDSTYLPFGFVDRYQNNTLIEGDWRNYVSPLRKPKKFYANNSTQSCFKLRDTLSKYFEKNFTNDTIIDDNAYSDESTEPEVITGLDT